MSPGQDRIPAVAALYRVLCGVWGQEGQQLGIIGSQSLQESRICPGLQPQTALLTSHLATAAASGLLGVGSHCTCLVGERWQETVGTTEHHRQPGHCGPGG